MTTNSSLYKQIRANILLLTTAAVCGLAFVAQVKASNIGSFLFNGIRYSLGAFALLPIALFFERKKINRQVLIRTLIAGAICGIIMVAAVNFQQFGIAINQSSGKSGFITSLYIVLIPIASIFFKKRTSLPAWIAVMMALTGLFLISVPAGMDTFNSQELFGDILVLISAFFWTAQILCVDRFAKGICPILFAVFELAVCGLISLLVSLFVDEISLSIIHSALIPILYGGLVSVGVGYSFQVLGQRDASPVVASIAMAGEAVFAMIGGVLILDETMTTRQIIGVILMSTSIFLAQVKFKKKDKSKKEA